MQVYKGIGEAVRGIVEQRGVRGLYCGLNVTLLEIVPYAALQFGCYDALTAAYSASRSKLAPKVAFLEILNEWGRRGGKFCFGYSFPFHFFLNFLNFPFLFSFPSLFPYCLPVFLVFVFLDIGLYLMFDYQSYQGRCPAIRLL
jgi:hypothetical protein